LAIGEDSSPTKASVGFSDNAGPIVTDAAPTVSSTTQDRKSPAEAKNPVRAVDTVEGR
jgi:hypothetical protein